MTYSKFSLVLVGLCMAVLLAACTTDPKESKEYKDLQAELAKIKGQDSLEAANIEVYKKLASIKDTNDLGILDEVIATDVINHDMDPRMTEKTGIEGYKEVMLMYYRAMPMTTQIKHISATGDLILAHVSMKGVNSGSMAPGEPATGKTVEVDGFDCMRIEGGKVKEIWSVINEKKMLQQLGMLPAEM
jgi:predicted ester cyclase